MELRAALVRQMQRLRGGIYLQDGAISPQQLTGGRHQTPEDEKSWHLLMLDRDQAVTACIWYMEHEGGASVDSLRARNCPLAAHERWSERFFAAVDGEMARARRLRLRFAEVGGWAVAPNPRCRSEGLLLALAAYSLGRISGGALGLTTATVRHASSTILRRIGGKHLAAADGPVPSYFDPRYDCEMELLRFDSRRPATKFAALIDGLKDKLSIVPVVASQSLSALPEQRAVESASALTAA